MTGEASEEQDGPHDSEKNPFSYQYTALDKAMNLLPLQYWKSLPHIILI